MRVSVDFDRPFGGLIFSKGHYSNPNCVHLPAGSGSVNAAFEIRLNECGMSSSGQTESNGQPNPAGSFVESTIIVQYDPQVQEVFDQARKLRCTWYDYYEKSVTFRPFQVNMLNAVTANFLGDNLQCWMQIQSGKGPWSSEVSGIVKIGQTMTMVLGIKDEDAKFDMIVRNCVAHDGKRTPIQLVNEMGCVIRPKIMSKFNKIKNFGSSATVVSYAYFQAFKFPDSMNVHFQCVIQVCRFNCPEPVCPENENEPLPQSPATPNPFNQVPDLRRQFVVSGQAGIQGAKMSQALPPQQLNIHQQQALLQRQNQLRARRRLNPNNRYGQRQGRDSMFNMNNYENGYYIHSRAKREGESDEEHRNKSLNLVIKTASTLQVLSPDDVAFRLNGNDVIKDTDAQGESKPTVCVTLTNTSGLLFISFLCVIVIAMVTSVFACLRRKKYSKKSKGDKAKENEAEKDKKYVMAKLQDPKSLKIANESLKSQIQHRKNILAAKK